MQVDLLLSRCYEVLGQPDRQLVVCRRVLETRPDLLGARLGAAASLQALGRHDDPLAIESIKLIQDSAAANPALVGTAYQLSLVDQLRRHEDKRNWVEVEKLLAQLMKDEARPELDKTLLKADLLIHQNNLTEATKVLNAARKEHPKDVR